MREDARTKGARLLAEHRLTVLRVDSERVEAECRGTGAIYRLGWLPDSGWTCSCPARGRCSHLWALLSVTVREAVAE
jgi:SWIM zinc finger